MSRRDTQLAVLLRRAQWMLDDAAHDLPAGRCTDDDREMLASVLDELTAALRGQELPPSAVNIDRVEQ
jgi:hypothetical protein